jgi:hypothetical protein
MPEDCEASLRAFTEGRTAFPARVVGARSEDVFGNDRLSNGIGEVRFGARRGRFWRKLWRLRSRHSCDCDWNKPDFYIARDLFWILRTDILDS